MRHSHRSVLFVGLGVLATGLLLAGCSKPPTEELNAAQATVDSVKALPDVQMYAMAQVQAAEEALAGVRQQVDEKKYDEARAALPAVTEQALAAVAAAASGKEAAMQAAGSAVAAAMEAVQAAQGKLAKAPRAAKAALQQSISEATALCAEAEAAQSAGDYAAASAKAAEASAKVAPAP